MSPDDVSGTPEAVWPQSINDLDDSPLKTALSGLKGHQTLTEAEIEGTIQAVLSVLRRTDTREQPGGEHPTIGISHLSNSLVSDVAAIEDSTFTDLPALDATEVHRLLRDGDNTWGETASVVAEPDRGTLVTDEAAEPKKEGPVSKRAGWMTNITNRSAKIAMRLSQGLWAAPRRAMMRGSQTIAPPTSRERSRSSQCTIAYIIYDVSADAHIILSAGVDPQFQGLGAMETLLAKRVEYAARDGLPLRESIDATHAPTLLRLSDALHKFAHARPEYLESCRDRVRKMLEAIPPSRIKDALVQAVSGALQKENGALEFSHTLRELHRIAEDSGAGNVLGPLDPGKEEPMADPQTGLLSLEAMANLGVVLPQFRSNPLVECAIVNRDDAPLGVVVFERPIDQKNGVVEILQVSVLEGPQKTAVMREIMRTIITLVQEGGNESVLICDGEVETAPIPSFNMIERYIVQSCKIPDDSLARVWDRFQFALARACDRLPETKMYFKLRDMLSPLLAEVPRPGILSDIAATLRVIRSILGNDQETMQRQSTELFITKDMSPFGEALVQCKEKGSTHSGTQDGFGPISWFGVQRESGDESIIAYAGYRTSDDKKTIHLSRLCVPKSFESSGIREAIAGRLLSLVLENGAQRLTSFQTEQPVGARKGDFRRRPR